jgi:Arc/MetJ-type ribon-helix-helix transcriptional regulator
MQISLPPEVEALVQRQLTSGKYENAGQLPTLPYVSV